MAALDLLLLIRLSSTRPPGHADGMMSLVTGDQVPDLGLLEGLRFTFHADGMMKLDPARGEVE